MDESQRHEYQKSYKEMRQRLVKGGFLPVSLGFLLLTAALFFFTRKHLGSPSISYLLLVAGLSSFTYGIFYMMKHYRCPRCQTVPMDQMTGGKTGLVLNPSHCLQCGLSFEEGVEDLKPDGDAQSSSAEIAEVLPRRPRVFFILAAVIVIGFVFFNLCAQRKQISAPSAPAADLSSAPEPVRISKLSQTAAVSFNQKSFQIEDQIIRQMGVFTSSQASYQNDAGGEAWVKKIDVRIYLSPEKWDGFLKENPAIENAASYVALKNQVLGYFRRVYPSPVEYTVQAVRSPLDPETMKKKRQAYFETNLRNGK